MHIFSDLIYSQTEYYGNYFLLFQIQMPLIKTAYIFSSCSISYIIYFGISN